MLFILYARCRNGCEEELLTETLVGSNDVNERQQ